MPLFVEQIASGIKNVKESLDNFAQVYRIFIALNINYNF